MTDAGEQDRSESPAPTGPATGPMVLWVVVQLGAIAISAARVPLAAKYPRPEEALAPHVLLVAQLVASSLLFPWLLRDRLTAAAVIATACPFAAIASALSALPLRQVAAGQAYVIAWITALALWRAALPGQKSALYAAAAASLLSVGGVALAYLSVEFAVAPVGESGDRFAARFGDFSPVVGALRVLTFQEHVGRAWISPTTAAIAAILVLLARRFLRRDKLSTSPPPHTISQGPITP